MQHKLPCMEILAETPQSLVVRTPAKINLFLEILGMREDGYHEIDTIMQTVSFFDEIRFVRQGQDVQLKTNMSSLETDKDNLVIKAVRKFQSHTNIDPAPLDINLIKNIPMGAGLGGGSSDAAATLIALNHMFQTALSKETLADLAADLGSDVPFFIYGGTARCRGRGEQVTPVCAPAKIQYILLCPKIHVSTAHVYAKLDENRLTASCDKTSIVLRALEKGDITALSDNLYNRLEEGAFCYDPQLADIKASFDKLGFSGTLMSGSGSSFFGIAADEKEVRRLKQETEYMQAGWVFAIETYLH